MNKVLYFQQNSAYGATEEYLSDLAKHVHKRGFEVHIAYPDLPVMGKFMDTIGDRAIHHRIPSGHYTLRSLFYWIKWFHELQPTIVHFNDPAVIGSLAASIARVQVRVMTHHTPEFVRNYNFMGKVLQQIAFKTYTKCVFTSEYDLRAGHVHDRIPVEKCISIPYGLRAQWFEPLDESLRFDVRSSLGLLPSDIVIINPARLSPQKRHDILLKAAQEVIAQEPQAHFLLAGDGELRQSISETIQNMGLSDRVHLLGFRKDILQLISAADILLMTSDFEGLCYAVIEAAARGVATVATKVGGMRYSIDDGVTGTLVPPGDAHEIVLALLKLIRDPATRHKFGLAGRQRAEELFTVQQMVERTVTLYRSLLQRQ